MRQTKSRFLRNFARVICLLAGATLTIPAAPAQFKSWVLAKLPDTPEGLATDARGQMYAALLHTGEVVRLKQGGYEHVAWVPSDQDHGKGALVGLEFDDHGTLYAAYKGESKYDANDLIDPFHPACRDATVTTSGVYKINPKSGAVTPLATRAQGWPFCFPDDVAIDSAGKVYMTDVTSSGIWKISPDGRKVDLWSSSPLLNWSAKPYTGVTLGVNDLVIDAAGKNIYAVTDAEPAVLRIPIKEDGSAGEPVILATGFSILDGLDLDKSGNIFISEITLNQIWALSPDGSKRVLIADKRNAPLDGNTSLVIRDGVLCASNLGSQHSPPQEADRTVVCMTGFPLP